MGGFDFDKIMFLFCFNSNITVSIIFGKLELFAVIVVFFDHILFSFFSAVAFIGSIWTLSDANVKH